MRRGGFHDFPVTVPVLGHDNFHRFLPVAGERDLIGGLAHLRADLPKVGLLAVWSVLAFVAVLRDMMPGPWITGALCAIALYFLGAGLLRQSE